MRYILFALSFLLVSLTANGQNVYTEDLESLKLNLGKAQSFKKQIKGRKKAAFEALYDSLKQEKPANRLEHIALLSELMAPLNDQHLSLYEKGDTQIFSSEENYRKYLNSEEFRSLPALEINTDSLKEVLRAFPPDSLQGIYYLGDRYSVGVIKIRAHTYLGVVLESAVPQWRPGHLVFRLNSTDGIYCNAVYAHPLLQTFSVNHNEKFRNGSLVNSSFYVSGKYLLYSKRKMPGEDHINLPLSNEKFTHKLLNDSTHYVLIRSFQRNTVTSGLSARFYQSIKDSLVLPHLVLDLRNNEGGSGLEMRKFVRLVKNYRGKVYVLLNNGTLSQAEIYTLILKQQKKVILMGQPTCGMLTYGSNYGRKITLAGGKHIFYPTDMGGRRKFLRYERYGIMPEVMLDDRSPWFSQVSSYIKVSSR